MTTTSPRDGAQLAESAQLPDGTDERFAGCAILGMPFGSGHYLAYRRFPASSIGPGYSAVWVLRPGDGWTIYADAPPELSCSRYFGAAPVQTRRTAIQTQWTGPADLTVTVPGIVAWEVELGSTTACEWMGRMARLMPSTWWRSQTVLSLMGAMAGPVLQTGRMGLAGQVPNGQTFQAKPLRLWAVTSSRAVIDGVDAGTPKPLPKQLRMADFWLPQRGLFATELEVRFPSTSGDTATGPAPSTSRAPAHHGLLPERNGDHHVNP